MGTGFVLIQKLDSFHNIGSFEIRLVEAYVDGENYRSAGFLFQSKDDEQHLLQFDVVNRGIVGDDVVVLVFEDDHLPVTAANIYRALQCSAGK